MRRVVLGSLLVGYLGSVIKRRVKVGSLPAGVALLVLSIYNRAFIAGVSGVRGDIVPACTVLGGMVWRDGER